MIGVVQRHAPGARVLEVGCGTGVLACVAARAGAREVWAVEPTAQAELAAAVVRENGLEGVVHVRRARIEDLPPREVDFAFAEVLNADPFAEGVVPVMAAAARWVRPGGRLAPARLRVWACLVRAGGSAREARAADAELVRIARAADLNLDRVRESLAGPADYRNIGAREVVAGPSAPVWDLDLRAGVAPEAVTRALTVDEAGPVAGVLVWFEAELDEAACLGNPPGAGGHWGQLVCQWAEERGMRAGEQVAVRVALEHDGVHATRAAASGVGRT